MTAETAHRLRLRLPNGTEFEAEGSAEFVTQERKAFMAGSGTAPSSGPQAGSEAAGGPAKEPAWERLVEAKGAVVQLRSKIEGVGAERDACLILMASARSLLRQPKPTAAQLARWLRASGYPILRVDRTIAAAITQGEILASGTRRARRYELSAPGLAKGWRLSARVAAQIQPAE